MSASVCGGAIFKFCSLCTITTNDPCTIFNSILVVKLSKWPKILWPFCALSLSFRHDNLWLPRTSNLGQSQSCTFAIFVVYFVNSFHDFFCSVDQVYLWQNASCHNGAVDVVCTCIVSSCQDGTDLPMKKPILSFCSFLHVCCTFSGINLTSFAGCLGFFVKKYHFSWFLFFSYHV